MVDVIITCALVAAGVIATAFVGLFFMGFFFLLFGFAYRVVTLANGSATWGMRFAGIELRDTNGGKLDLGQAFLHTLAFSVCFAIFPLHVVSAVLMLTSAQGQGLPDHFVGTVMLNRKA